jgi:hypothetical protein
MLYNCAGFLGEAPCTTEFRKRTPASRVRLLRSISGWDEKAAAWHADAGGFTIHVSRSSADPQLEGKITLEQPIVLPVN